MSHEIMIPDAAQLPAHIINPELARQIAEKAGEGISAGRVPRIKMASKTFVLVDSDGVETIIMPAELEIHKDGNQYLAGIVLDVKGPLPRAFYIAEYDKDADAEAPDCFSNDGLKPDASVKSPQCDVCAGCPQAAYGSAKKGEGQACAQTKIAAVLIPKRGVYKLKVTPAALKFWKSYCKSLGNAGLPLTMVRTLIGFKQDETYPILQFQYGGPVIADQSDKSMRIIAALAEKAESQEVRDIIEDKMQAAPPKTEGKSAAKKVEEPAKKVEEPVKKPEPVEDELGLGLGEDEPVEQKAAEPDKEVASTNELSDDDIAAELGL